MLVGALVCLFAVRGSVASASPTITTQLDCSQGCLGDTARVCGQDGLTYQNSCLATCQGAQVARPGPCETEVQQALPAASFLDISSSSRGGGSASQAAAISLQDMQQYSRQGYKLVARGQVGEFDPKAPSIRQAHASKAAAGAAASTGTRPAQQRAAATAAVRYASNGFTYQLPPAAASSSTSTAEQEGSETTTHTPSTVPSGSEPGFNPTMSLNRIPFERGVDPMEQPAMQVAGSAATSAIEGMPAQPDNAAPATLALIVPAVGQAGTVGAQTELLVQFMQVSGHRKLLDASQHAAFGLQQHWHSHHHHHMHEQQPPLPWLLGLQQQQQLPGLQTQQQVHHEQQDKEQQEARRALQYVLGTDERREVTSRARSWPYSAVGQLLYRQGSCTGVMIGPGSVLTAAHCVYSRQLNMWQNRMVFVPHRHRRGGRAVEPYGRIPVDYVTTYSGWTNNNNATDALRYDLAVVKLADSSIGHQTGWLGLSWDRKPYTGRVYSAGYPGDKARGSLWLTTCTATDYGGSDTRFFTSCDSWSGQSGSPMWDKMGQDMYYLRAVMSYEACSCCTPDCSCCTDHINAGCKITRMHFNNIMNWRV